MKNARYTILFYAVALEIIFALNSWSPGAAGTPGLGIVAFLIFLPICLGLFIRSIYRVYTGNKTILPSTIIHCVCIAGMIVLMSI